MLKKAKPNEEARHIVLTEAVKHLFNTVGSDDILKEKNGKMYFEGKPLTDEKVKNIKEQAKLLPNLLLWKIIQKDIQYQINKKLYEEAVITQDMLWGKLITFYNDVIKTRIKNL